MQPSLSLKTLRAFVAVEFPPSLRERLGEVAAELQRSLPGRVVNWVSPANMHLTLKFLGDTPEGDVPRICEALATAAKGVAPFTVEVGGLGCFPNLRQPRVVWAGVNPQEPVLKLQAAVEGALGPLGYEPESRRFSAHLTLGRVRREASPGQASRVGEAVRGHSAARAGQAPIGRLVLFKSDLRPPRTGGLRPQGPLYTRLFAANLNG